MMAFAKRPFALAAIAASISPLTVGCVGHLVPAEASFRGFPVPVMLVGSRDRVGSNGRPLSMTKVGEYDGSAQHSFGSSSHSDDGATVTTDVTRTSDSVASGAEEATEKFAPGEVDIRLTKVKPQSYGMLVKFKARVDLAGDVVRVEGAK